MKKFLNISLLIFLLVTLFGVDPMINPVLADPPLPLPRLPICGDQDGSETPLITNCPDLAVVADVQTFEVPGSDDQILNFDFVFREAGYNNELGYFIVDDTSGIIDGKKPDEDGYLQLALQRAHMIFPSGSYANTPDQSLSVVGGTTLVFFIVQNNTLMNLAQFNPKNELNKTPLAFFSIDSLNPDGKDHFIGYISTEGTDPITQFGFEDLTGGGDSDYDDVVFNIHSVLQPGQIDSDRDGLPDSWETTGIDTNGDGILDFSLQQLGGLDGNSPLAELDGPSPANLKQKDIYVWVDWMQGHRPDEAALRLVKQAFNDAPVPTPEGELPGVDLHIVYGHEVSEIIPIGELKKVVVNNEEVYAYNSDQFFSLKRQYLENNGLNPGMAGVFHYALFADSLSKITEDCTNKEGSPSGIAPMISSTDAGSDFIVAGAVPGSDKYAVGGTFMHELGHTLNLGHGGPGILNDVNYKPNQLSVMNYSFQDGLIYPRDPLGILPPGHKLDYSRFGSDTLPPLDEEHLDELDGLGGNSENYGTIFYRTYKDHEPDKSGFVELFPADGVNWNGNDIWGEPSVKVNINGDFKKDSSGNCVEIYSSLETFDEWAGLNYKTGTIGAAAILVPPPPTETFISINNVDLNIDLSNLINRPPVLDLIEDQVVQYSDLITFDASATDPNDPSTSLEFSAVGLPNDLSLIDNGNGAASVTGIATVAPGTYTIQISVTDPGGLSDTKPVEIVVTQEDARATYTGPLMVSTACETCSTATIPLRATIQDITAVDPVADPDPGDIRNATVTFVNRDGGAALCTATLTLLDPNDTKTASAACNWDANIGSSSGTDFTIGVVVGGYYLRNATAEDTVVSISKPGTNFLTGGGYFINKATSGLYAGDAGAKTNFGLNIKFNNKLTNLQGRATIMVRMNGHVYQIRSNMLSSLVAVPYNSSTPSAGTAELIGKANITDVTDPMNPVLLVGGATFQIAMKDNGEPGNADTLSISVWGKDGKLLFSSNWSGTKTLPQTLDGGNIQVH